MTAPAIIQALVNRFRDSRELYRSGRYNEAQLRQEFLNPFFEALGWDMFNRSNLRPPIPRGYPRRLPRGRRLAQSPRTTPSASALPANSRRSQKAQSKHPLRKSTQPTSCAVTPFDRYAEGTKGKRGTTDGGRGIPQRDRAVAPLARPQYRPAQLPPLCHRRRKPRPTSTAPNASSITPSRPPSTASYSCVYARTARSNPPINCSRSPRATMSMPIC